jgi:hypothetical protein
MSASLGLDPEDPLVRAAVFGVHVEEWIKTDVGAFVMNRVQQRVKRLEQDLRKINPTNPLDVLKLQIELKHWEDFAGWLGDAMQAGANAQTIIEGEQLADTEDG